MNNGKSKLMIKRNEKCAFQSASSTASTNTTSVSSEEGWTDGRGGEGERNQQERKRGIKKETTTTKNHHRKRKKGAYTREKSNRSESTDRYVSIPQEGTQNWHPAKQSLYPNEIIASKSKSHQIPPLYLYRNFKSVLVSPSNTYHESQHIYR